MSPAIAQPLDKILNAPLPTMPGTATSLQPKIGTAGPLMPGTPQVPPTGGITGVATPRTGPPPSSLLDAMLGGGEVTPPPENPWTNPFMEVYETTKAGGMQNLEEMQKDMAERFAHRGGYFGGKHAISQAKLAEKTGTSLDQLLSQVSLGASERAYQDWLRARQETMMPFNMISPLLGQQTTQPLITQDQGPWGAIASAIGPALGAGVAKSSEKFKKDIHLLDENDESRIFEQMADVPIFKYKYRADPEGKERIGLISEKAPKEITFLEDTFVGLYEYIGMLHATLKTLSRKVQRLEGNRRN